MPFSLKPASLKDKPLIHSMLQPYLTDLSRFPDEHADYKDKNGIYIYPYLDAYWVENERFPYLLIADGQLAGFVLVRRDRDYWEMAEFYVKPEFRRRRLAQYSATEIFLKHPGAWRIGFNKHNKASRALWKKLSECLSKNAATEGETDGSHDYIIFSV